MPQLRHPPRAALDLAERAADASPSRTCRPRTSTSCIDRLVRDPFVDQFARPTGWSCRSRPGRPASSAPPARRPEPRQPRHALRRDRRLRPPPRRPRLAPLRAGRRDDAHRRRRLRHPHGRAEHRPPADGALARRRAPAVSGIADDEVGGKHHMGTTRMSATPEGPASSTPTAGSTRSATSTSEGRASSPRPAIATRPTRSSSSPCVSATTSANACAPDLRRPCAQPTPGFPRQTLAIPFPYAFHTESGSSVSLPPSARRTRYPGPPRPRQ